MPVELRRVQNYRNVSLQAFKEERASHGPRWNSSTRNATLLASSERGVEERGWVPWRTGPKRIDASAEDIWSKRAGTWIVFRGQKQSDQMV